MVIATRRRVTHFFEDFRECRSVELNELLVTVSRIRTAQARRTYNLEFVEIVSELLESFFKSHEACRDLGYRCTSCLHDSFLVQESFEAKFEL